MAAYRCRACPTRWCGSEFTSVPKYCPTCGTGEAVEIEDRGMSSVDPVDTNLISDGYHTFGELASAGAW